MRRLLLALLIATPASAQTLKPDEVFSDIAVEAVGRPEPVQGADGRTHLAFELTATNYGVMPVTLDRVRVLDPADHAIADMAGDKLKAMIVNKGGTGATLKPGGAATVIVDGIPLEGAPPASVRPQVNITRQSVGADGKPAPLPANYPFPATDVFTGSAVTVGARPAIVVSAPLRGARWLVLNGCCNEVTSHRGALMSVNGKLRVPERYAIDWIRLDESGRAFTGDGSKVKSYAFYGAPVYAVADGTVVNLYDGLEPQVPGRASVGITAPTIGGNMVVVDIGGGAYAFFAHLEAGSLRVKLGDHVKRGQVIGLLGNTGNSDAPHLHFHIMDGPSPLNANGLPYEFERFTGLGQVAPGSEEALAVKGEAARIDRAALAGPHARQLPLNNQLVDFGD